jgi:hypothetical protein
MKIHLHEPLWGDGVSVIDYIRIELKETGDTIEIVDNVNNLVYRLEKKPDGKIICEKGKYSPMTV